MAERTINVLRIVMKEYVKTHTQNLMSISVLYTDCEEGVIYLIYRVSFYRMFDTLFYTNNIKAEYVYISRMYMSSKYASIYLQRNTFASRKDGIFSFSFDEYILHNITIILINEWLII